MDSEKQGRRATEIRQARNLMRRLLIGLKGHLDDELRSRNVTGSQLRLLQEVREQPGRSGAQLARACYVTPQSAQTMITRAVERGWIVRGTDAENHRLVTAQLTPAGERLLEYADGVLTRLEADVWADVSVKDLRGMNAVMERAIRNLRQ